MRKSLIVLIACILLVPGLYAASFQVTVGSGTSKGPFHYHTGGEFTLTVNQDLMFVLENGYVEGITKNVDGYPNSFQAFCVEPEIRVNPGETYDAGISQVTTTGVDLTLGAAWLYHQFQIGSLDGYFPRSEDRVAALASAIWYFMGRPYYGDNLVYINLAYSMFEDPFLPNDSEIPVAVLNLYEIGTGNEIQDMLVCVPDGGLTVLLLGLGLGYLAFFKRKIK